MAQDTHKSLWLLVRAIASPTALGRWGGLDDIGGAIAALLTADNRWINGHRIKVSGGMLL